ncbi:MAG: hypothetical protein ACE5JI_12495 [Acidobacteriota bacterium]
MAESPSSLLRQLEHLRSVYGGEVRVQRLQLVRKLEQRRLRRGRDVFRLHELLCFLRAYPDDEEVLAQVEGMLDRFDRRSDLRRHRAELVDTGIAGTDIYYSFYWVTARWLARRWPDRLSIHWAEFDKQDRLGEILDLLLPYSETPGLDLVDYPARAWLERLRGAGETDARFLIRRFEGLAADATTRERLYEQMDVPLRLSPGPDTPCRTRAKYHRSEITFQTLSLSRRRPSLRRDVALGPPAVSALTARDGRNLIDLAREAMVTRSRDLDAFAYADENDVRMVGFERGLQFAVLGLCPERRLMLETSYGLLTLKNGVPMGYALASSLFRSTEVAYNVFDTFRGGEAALIFARFLGLVHHLFRSDTFIVDPYQLGHGNLEGLRSGAWWFYHKLGFRPIDAEVRRVARTELQRMKTDPRHRSSIGTLKKSSAEPVFLYLDKPRKDVLGRIFLGNVGLRITDYLAERFGADREAAIKVCSREAAHLVGLDSQAQLSPGERLAWERWSPLVRVLPEIERWSASQKRALLEVILAKGGRRESDYVLLFDRHRRLREAVLELAKDA